MRILILSRDDSLVATIRIALVRPIDRFTTVETVGQAQDALQSSAYDLVVADRKMLAHTPAETQHLLLEMAHHTSILLIDGGQSGGRAIVEMMGRGRSVPQAQNRESSGYRIGDLFIDTRKKRVVLGDRWVNLPPLEYRLLVALAARQGEVVPYRELLHVVWGYEAGEREARELLKSHVRQIRRRLGLDQVDHRYIQAVRGFGYMLIAPSDECR